jgi:hypothetical protein
MPDPQHSVLRKQIQAKTQNLLREYSDLLISTIEEVKRELNVEITGSTSDEIALEYKRRQGGREALNNFLTKLNSKANERT